MRCIKPKYTYKEWSIALYRSIVPQELDPLSVEIINDTYKSFSVKNGTRLARGEVSIRVYLQGFEQQMVKGKEWNSFFNKFDC